MNGRIQTNHNIDETVEAFTREMALKKALKLVYKKLDITIFDVVDEEVYAEKLKQYEFPITD